MHAGRHNLMAMMAREATKLKEKQFNYQLLRTEHRNRLMSSIVSGVDSFVSKNLRDYFLNQM